MASQPPSRQRTGRINHLVNYDAGVRLGEQLAKDMIAAPLGPPLSMAVVAAPSYFERHPVPQTPQDLTSHNCINFRLPTYGGQSVWEFDKDRREMRVRVEGQLVFNNAPLRLASVCDGLDIAYMPEDFVLGHIADGKLIRVFENWCEPFADYHLYYPPPACFARLRVACRRASMPGALVTITSIGDNQICANAVMNDRQLSGGEVSRSNGRFRGDNGLGLHPPANVGYPQCRDRNLPFAFRTILGRWGRTFRMAQLSSKPRSPLSPRRSQPSCTTTSMTILPAPIAC